MIEIRNRWSGRVIVADAEAETLRDAVLRAVANRTDLRGSNLRGSDLSDSNLSGSDLRGSNLSGSNLSGSDLSGSDLRGSDLSGSNLSGSDLSDSNLRGSNLSGSNLSGSNLSGSNLSGSNLSDSNLRGSNLSGSNLPSQAEPTPEQYAERALRFRERHPEVPVVPLLDATVCKLVNTGEGRLEMGSWHSCETTHCRAGWAIHLAGDAGYALEKRRGPEMAGAMIYKASTGRWPNFFASNEDALTDICKWGATEEAAQAVV